MFTPMKVAKGPVNAQAVGDWRVTIGEFVSGGSFCKVDEWKTMNEPHEQLPRPWKGTTYFVSSVGTCKETRGEDYDCMSFRKESIDSTQRRSVPSAALGSPARRRGSPKTEESPTDVRYQRPLRSQPSVVWRNPSMMNGASCTSGESLFVVFSS